VLSSFNTHPDWIAIFGALGRYSFVGGSAVGRLHSRERRGREDSLLVRSKGDWLCAAVADGVGNAPKGVWGSALAVSAFTDRVLFHLPYSCTRKVRRVSETRRTFEKDSASLSLAGWHEVGVLSFFQEGEVEKGEIPPWETVQEYLFEAGEYTHRMLQDLAQREGKDPQDFATTLLCCLFHVVEEKGAFFHIGDGALLGVRKDGKSVLLSVQEGRDTGEVEVLTQPDWQDFCRAGTFDFRRDYLSAFMLMTDGLADDCLYGPPEDITDRFALDILREIRATSNREMAARRLVFWLGTYTLPGSFDDRTLVVVYR
jgi:serine/threonine protein phosphatase PrpC